MTAAGRGALALLAGLACACGEPRSTGDTVPPPASGCSGAAEGPAQAASLRADGHLSRALASARAAQRRCPSTAARRQVAEILADLGRDAEAVAAWQEVARAGDAGDRTAAAAAIAELRRRPPPTRAAADEERARALLLYRDGVDLRLRGRLDESLAQLRRSYALAPHPLTIVQIGLTHAAAGRPIDARIANERALALAELTRGRPVTPRLLPRTTEALSIAWDPRGGRLASGHEGGRILLWDLATGRTDELTGPDEQIWAVAFSPDGRTLATAGNDRVVRLWDPAARQIVREMQGHGGAVTALQFRAGGRVLASGGDQTVRLWDPASGTSVKVMSVAGGVRGLAFAPDGSQLATASDEGGVETWDVDAGRRLRRFVGRGSPVAVAWSAGGDRLASVHRGGLLMVWNAATGALIGTLGREQLRAEHLAYSPSRDLIATGGLGKVVQLWQSAVDAPVLVLSGHRQNILAVAFNGDGSLLASASADGSVRVWDPGAGTLRRTFEREYPPVLATVALPGRLLVGSGDQAGHAIVWQVGGDASRREMAEHAGLLRAMAISADGMWMASAGSEARIRIKPLAGAGRPRGPSPEGATNALAFDDTGGLLLSAGDAGIAQLWATASGTEVARFDGQQSEMMSAAIDGAGRVVATGSRDGSIRVWDAAGPPRASFAGHAGAVTALCLSRDGGLLLSGGQDRTVKLWDVHGGVQLSQLDHGGWVSAVAIDRRRRLLASADQSGRVILWTIAGQRLREVQAHADAVTVLRFDEGDRLLTGGRDGGTRLWDTGGLQLELAFVQAATGSWLAMDGGGRLDGSPVDATRPDGGGGLLAWRAGDLELPGFVGWERALTPGLVARILEPR